MAVQTVGTSLKVDKSPEARQLSIAITKYLIKLNRMVTQAGGTLTAETDGQLDCRVFHMANVPTENVEIESPGGDMCFIVDTTNYDLWLVTDWVTSTDYTVTKIRDNAG